LFFSAGSQDLITPTLDEAYIPTKGMYLDFEGVCILDFSQVGVRFSETPGLKKRGLKKESRQSKIGNHEPYKSTKSTFIHRKSEPNIGLTILE
jgi:hypothetical protein